MNRNRVDRFSNVPTPSLPRTKQDFGVHTRLQTYGHGKLYPFYCRMVYPHSTIKIDMVDFDRMDTSLKVPLDNVYKDNYFFFIPFRILDPNFEKILGHKTVYDSNTYAFPKAYFDLGGANAGALGTTAVTHDSLLNYLGLGALNDKDNSDGDELLQASTVSNTGHWIVKPTKRNSDYVLINTYPLAAYYLVWNQYFRDENLDNEIPIEDLLTQGSNISLNTLASASGGSIWNNFDVLPVNRYHDIFSSGCVSPIKGGVNGDVLIPLGTSAVPVVTGTEHYTSGEVDPMLFRDNRGNRFSSNALLMGESNGHITGSSNSAGSAVGYSIVPSNLYADLAGVGTSVNQLYLSLALYSLLDKRGTFGTRLIEQIRGSFGLEVPDGLLDRAEYLGGSVHTMNNTPVLNTAASMGTMVGNSATLGNMTSIEKSFNEWGIVIGVSCTRIKHTFNQGIQNPVFKMFDNLDMYWPEFANISKTAVKKRRLIFSGAAKDEEAFNFNEPWIDEHTEQDFAAGDFGSFRDSRYNELATKWSYQDLYDSFVSFNATWLKEPVQNLVRTLSGTLIPGSTASYAAGAENSIKTFGHQFMCKYKYKVQLTMPIPVRSHVPNITGRL